MTLRTTYANLADGLQNLSLWDASLSDMGSLGVIPCTASGTNTIVLTPVAAVYAPNINNPPNANQLFSFVAANTSTSAVTVTISGVTSALKLYQMDGATQAGSGDIKSGVLYAVSYNSALNSGGGGFQILFPVSTVIGPVISGATITTSTYNGNTITAGAGTLNLGGFTATFGGAFTTASTFSTTGTFSSGGNFATTGTFSSGGNFSTSSTFSVTGALSIGGAFTTASTFSTTGTFSSGGNFATTGTFTSGGNFSTSSTFSVTGALSIAGAFTTAAAFTQSGAFATTLTSTATTNSTLPAGTHTLAGLDVAQTWTALQIYNNSDIALLGSSTGKTTFTSANTGASDFTLTFPAATDTLVGRATTDTLTNKTFDSAGTGNTLQVSSVTVSRGQFPATNTNDNATAGNIGDYVNSDIASGSAVSLTSSTAANVTSISLGAGDWEVSANAGWTGGATTTVTQMLASLSTTSATIDTTDGREIIEAYNAFTVFNNATFINKTLGPARFSLSSTTTVYLVIRATFAVSTCSGFGLLRARRVR